MTDDPNILKKYLFGKISRKLTFLFSIVGIVAPTIGIIYFYMTSFSILPFEPTVSVEQNTLLSTTAITIIFLIALNASIIGFLISRSISKPIEELHRATTELEKGNFTVRANVTTIDELGELSRAFNKSAIALGLMDEEYKQLEQTKSEFLSMTSHELRTPITPLKTQLQMLYKQYYGKLTKKQRETLMNILKNTERLNKIIEDFMEISRIEAARLKFSFKKTDLRDTVYETVNLMEGFAKEKNIQIITDMGKLPVINVDPDRVCQVLKNLLHNAIKFSPNNSKIEISAVLRKGYIELSVTDYGIGMSQEDQIRIYEPFYQVKENNEIDYGGTGLGLAICRGIIEAQNGKIWIQSSKGKGSAFYFTVPLKPVEKVLPIRLLFSPKFEVEKELKEIFISLLGPMGIAEYDELQISDSIKIDKILEYIDELKKDRILDNNDSTLFEFEVKKIFSDNYSDGQDEINLENNEEEGGIKI
jgi:signal transduction histidine kinase